MGLFDNLFGVFTGTPQLEAAQQQRTYVDALRNQMEGTSGRAEARGVGYLNTGLQGGLGTLGDFYHQANSDIYGGLGGSVGAYQNYGQAANDAILSQEGLGLHTLGTGLQGAVGAYDELEQLGQGYGREARRTSAMAGDALGLNGPDGLARANSAFEASPGFQFALDTGLESIARNANAAGMAASGNMLQESQRYGTGLAQQDYNNWANRLAQREGLFNPLEAQTIGQAEAGMANANLSSTGAMGNLIGQTGAGLSNINLTTGGRVGDAEMAAARMYSDLSQRMGPIEAQMYMQSAQGQADLARMMTGMEFQLASSSVSPYIGSFMNAANAQAQAGQNVLGGIGAAGSLFSGIGDFLSDIF